MMTCLLVLGLLVAIGGGISLFSVIRSWIHSNYPVRIPSSYPALPPPPCREIPIPIHKLDVIGCYGRMSHQLAGEAAEASNSALAFIYWPESRRDRAPAAWYRGPGPRKYNDTVVIQSSDLKKTLKRYVDSFNVSVGQSPEIQAHKLFNLLDYLRKELEKRETPDLRALISLLEEEFGPVRQKMTELLLNQKMGYDFLWCLFPLGSAITFKDPYCGLACAGTVLSATYKQSNAFADGDSTRKQWFEIIAQYIDYDGCVFYYGRHSIVINSFVDTIGNGCLEAQPLSEGQLKEKFRLRGEKFVALKGQHHLEYNGSMSVPLSAPSRYPGADPGFMGTTHVFNFRATGRVMIDCLTYAKMVPSERVSVLYDMYRFEEVPTAEFYLCAPTLRGYSLVTKRWGRFAIEQLRDIRWDSNPLQHLVLPEEKKALIRSLVNADQDRMITDVIAGKSGGFLVVLHGKPGTGKTLTAEAAAQNARKPLMIVSGTELGDPGLGMETVLRDTLYLCKTWGALLLIDEAEVYLEARSVGDVRRNAMVSIFLRLLEYHQQVIFLTTNHISRLDAAFKSRIAVAMKYPDLEVAGREEIWRRFVEMAGVAIVDKIPLAEESSSSITKKELRKLAMKELNGRQIKNSVRTAQAVAAEHNEPINFLQLSRVLDMIGEFGDFEGACECQQRKLGYYGGGDLGNHLQDLKAQHGRLPF